MKNAKLMNAIGKKKLVAVIITLVLLYAYWFQKLDSGILKNYTKPLNVSQQQHFVKLVELQTGGSSSHSSSKRNIWRNLTESITNNQKYDFIKLDKLAAKFVNQYLSKYGYNAVLSDALSLNRSIPDTRHQSCKNRLYPDNLPTVSVIVPFYNERSSVVLRTLHSLLNRGPEHLIKEILLVDDASDKDLLTENFNTYVEENFPKVKVMHLTNRSGIVRARLAAAKAATADVFLFLDSHIEANVNWLPPLLEPIAQDYQTVTVPLLDYIDYNTFEYKWAGEGARGLFDWYFKYQRCPLMPTDANKLPDPFKSPIMHGGFFAISRRFFWELGGFDRQLLGWGGEQFELSFKIWLCGGRMVEVPCSRIGHIYRYTERPGQRIHTPKNYKRVAEVWMDEYTQYLYARLPDVKKTDPGDLTEQKALKHKLNCKPFKWFMSQIAFDLTQYFPLEEVVYAEGRIRPKLSPYLCIDGKNAEEEELVVLNRCHLEQAHFSKQNEQQFQFTWFNDVMLKSSHLCWDLKNQEPGSHVMLYSCHHSGGNQQWRYDEKSKQIKFIDNTTSICLDHNSSNRELFVSFCDDSSETQLWVIDTVNKEQLAKWKLIAHTITGPVET